MPKGLDSRHGTGHHLPQDPAYRAQQRQARPQPRVSRLGVSRDVGCADVAGAELAARHAPIGSAQYGSGSVSSLPLAAFSDGTPCTLVWVMARYLCGGIRRDDVAAERAAGPQHVPAPGSDTTTMTPTQFQPSPERTGSRRRWQHRRARDCQGASPRPHRARFGMRSCAPPPALGARKPLSAIWHRHCSNRWTPATWWILAALRLSTCACSIGKGGSPIQTCGLYLDLFA